VTLVDDLHGVLLGFSLSRESENVLRLSVGDLVDPEPFVGGSDETWEVSLDVFNVVKTGSEGVVDVDDEDLVSGVLRFMGFGLMGDRGREGQGAKRKVGRLMT
jgi:hypothetical protein